MELELRQCIWPSAHFSNYLSQPMQRNQALRRHAINRKPSPAMQLLPSTTRRLLQLLLLISAVVTTSAAAALYPSGHDPWPDDEEALVAFRAKISGHSGVLDSWNQSTSYCSWEGVTCGRRHRWRVVSLDLSSQGLAGTISPSIEYGEGLAVSTSGDVFSLGITLIEMFTGKCPTDDMFRDGTSLHYYAKAALPENVMEIADSNMWLHDGVNSSNDTTHITRTWECLSAVIQLGVICSKQLPTERLSMNDAAAEMHAIRDKYISTQ